MATSCFVFFETQNPYTLMIQRSPLLHSGPNCASRLRHYVTSFRVRGKQTHVLRKLKTLPTEEIRCRAITTATRKCSQYRQYMLPYLLPPPSPLLWFSSLFLLTDLERTDSPRLQYLNPSPKAK
jgi:hypothetical protein